MPKTPKLPLKSEEFTITKAANLNLRQLDEISVIERTCRLSHWSKEDYINESKRQNSILLIAEVNELPNSKIIGFILLRINLPDVPNELAAENYLDADLLNFGVAYQSQGMGIGNALFTEAYLILGKQGISSVWLEVRQSNLKAIRFYEKRNFFIVQVRKNFYNQPLENALLMKLDIPPIDSPNVV